MKNRKGIIKVSKQGVEMLDRDLSFAKVLFTNFSPHSIETDSDTGERTYEGISSHFRELTDNEILPTYTYEITKYIGQDYRFIKFTEQPVLGEVSILKEEVTRLKKELKYYKDLCLKNNIW